MFSLECLADKRAQIFRDRGSYLGSDKAVNG